MTGPELIDLVVSRAKELREVGVSSIQIEGSTVVLAPLAARFDTSDDETAIATPPTDPLMNPATYAGGVVPGFTMMVK